MNKENDMDVFLSDIQQSIAKLTPPLSMIIHLLKAHASGLEENDPQVRKVKKLTLELELILKIILEIIETNEEIYPDRGKIYYREKSHHSNN